MDMTSFIVTVGAFFKMDTGKESNFACDMSNYLIPKYQREYKWDEERVRTLITDIRNHDKFLGNVILNRVQNCYEIVDGQQRITTIMLILIALFNRNQHPNQTARSEEQNAIINYLLRGNKFILENESIGEYILINDTHIDMQIDASNDIYFQKGTFENILRIINDAINDADHGVKDSELLTFQQKVLDCKVLVLIGTPDGRLQDSIEEVFLDINFKSQLLDVANIFKGYCFKNYDSVSHGELKKQWACIRSLSMLFEVRFGYEENRETCEYLYLYLLSMPESYNISANLSWAGKHCLEEKNHTQTKELLVGMIDYGKNVVAFDKELTTTTYFFEDICCDAYEHKKEVLILKAMKSMALITIESKEAQYYKLPFFMLIHRSLEGASPNDAPEFSTLKALITNFYIYAFLFLNSGKQKNKKLISRDLLGILHNKQYTTQEKAKKVLPEIKSIRKVFIEEFVLFRNFSKKKAYAFYSIMDYYVANTNFISSIYSSEAGFTPEHFLIHDNSTMNVTWNSEVQKFDFSLKELLGKPDGKNYKGTSYKKQTSNYLILPKQLNENIKSNDIISKIHDIEKYFWDRNEDIPNHIMLLIAYIKKMPTYQDLVQLKGTQHNKNAIEEKYKIFINSYFSDENQAAIYALFENAFKEVFHNQP
ncbi:MAG: DUF262 domain-containing protein [Lachnospiraceae bacterium]